MNRIAARLFEHDLRLARERDALHVAIKDGGRNLREHFLETTTENKAKKRTAFYAARDQVRERTITVRAGLNPKEQAGWDTFSKEMEIYYGDVESALKLSDEGQPQKAYAFTATVARPHYTASMKSFEEVDKLLATAATVQIAVANSTQQRLAMLLLAGGLISALTTFLLAWLNIRGVRQPVNELGSRMDSLATNELASLTGALECLADGDLTRPVEGKTELIVVGRGDEFGQMAHVFNRMLTSLRVSQQAYETARHELARVLDGVAQGAKHVGNTAHDLDAATRTASDRTQRVDAVLRDTAKALKSAVEGCAEVASGGEQLALDAGRAAEAMERLHLEVVEVGQVSQSQNEATQNMREELKSVAKTLRAAATGMQGLQDSVGSASGTLRILDERQGEIESIVSTIRGISDQTNLLALNAAIEAARAGEQGRGFAVVADEVRKLAEQAGQATGQISALISEIRAGVDSSITAMASSTESVAQNVQVTQASQASLETLAEVADRVAALSQENRQHVEAMTKMADSVTRAIESVASVSQESAASAQMLGAANQQIAASTEHLAQESAEQTASARHLQEQATELAGVSAEVDETLARFIFEKTSLPRAA